MTRRPLLTPSQRRAFLSLCAAAYGAAMAISMYPLWLRPAPAGQLPGFMTEHHLDARASYWFFAGVVLITIAVPFVLRGVVERLTRAEARAWARNGAAGAMLAALWSASVTRNLAWTALPAAIAIVVCVLLRRVQMHFSRRDVVLLPTAAAVYMALLDTTRWRFEDCLIAATAIVLAVRLLIALVRRDRGLSAPLCFAVAPLALALQTQFFARDERYAGWPVLLIALATPFILRSTISNSGRARRRLRAAIALVVYPVALYAYTSATNQVTAEGRFRVSLFEDAQHLVPGAEIARGRLPYRDIIPPHGLIQDGLLDAAILRHGPHTIGNVLKVRGTLGGLLPVAEYAAAAAAAGSADAGLLAFFVAMLFSCATGSFRFAPSLIALALSAWAVRRSSVRLIALAAAMAVFAGLTSIDFGVYAAIAVVAAALIMRPRMRALAAALAGSLAVAIPACLFMFAGGYLADFFRVTFVELAELRSVYALMPFDPPPGFDRPLPEMIAATFDMRSLPFFLWMATLAGTAVLVASGPWPLRRFRSGPVIVIAIWVLACGISFAERQHIYFMYAMFPLVTAVLWRWWHARGSLPRFGAIAIAAVVLIAGVPTFHLGVVSLNRRARGHGPTEAGWQEVGLPRARGAFFRDYDTAAIDSVYRYTKIHLSGEQTFFDFTNRGILYFLLDKRIPVRQIEVAFYEPVARQREVIARLEHDRQVTCAIVPGPEAGGMVVDGMPGSVRAPLVWEYLQTHFEPDFVEGDVAIWKRK